MGGPLSVSAAGLFGVCHWVGGLVAAGRERVTCRAGLGDLARGSWADPWITPAVSG